MGDSLYHCGHGETAPLRGLFSSLTWAASVPPEAASFVVCIDGAREKGDATLGSSQPAP